MGIAISFVSFTLIVPILIDTIFPPALLPITELWSHPSNITSPPCAAGQQVVLMDKYTIPSPKGCTVLARISSALPINVPSPPSPKGWQVLLSCQENLTSKS